MVYRRKERERERKEERKNRGEIKEDRRKGKINEGGMKKNN